MSTRLTKKTGVISLLLLCVGFAQVVDPFLIKKYLENGLGGDNYYDGFYCQVTIDDYGKIYLDMNYISVKGAKIAYGFEFLEDYIFARSIHAVSGLVYKHNLEIA